MYNLLESLRSAMQSIWAHRLRSFLTMLGIIIGVAAVVAVVSLVQGLNHYVSGELEGLGSNNITIRS
ncbi:MAG TPA: ABC transporter permease, partial [Gammaproteobacteria bacterium]